jgi:hypothetical protein
LCLDRFSIGLDHQHYGGIWFGAKRAEGPMPFAHRNLRATQRQGISASPAFQSSDSAGSNAVNTLFSAYSACTFAAIWVQLHARLPTSNSAAVGSTIAQSEA